MLTRRTFAALASVTALASQASAQAQSSSGPRRAEVEALRRFAETTHPRGCEAAADADWRGRWDRLAAEADTLSDGAYFQRTRRALGWFKDGHTTPLPFEFIGGVPAQLAQGPFSLALSLRVQVFHDGAYVVEAKDEALPLLGARLTRVGATDVEPLIRAWAQEWPGNDAWAHRWASALFAPALLQALDVVRDASAPVRFEGMVGRRRVRATLSPRAGAREGLQALQHAPTPRETWESEAGQNYVRALAEHRALYVSMDAMEDFETRTFEAFTRAVAAAMEDASAERLIVDVRRNGGGNNFLPEPLRKRITRSRFNRPGGLYWMISPMTFSAAQNPSTRIERDTFALFVGEPSGGAPNHYGDAQPFTGEATGMVSIVSTLAWFDSYPQDTRPWIMPDIPAPSTFADWRAGRDAALEAAFTHTTANGAVDPWEGEHVFFFSRDSQSAEWRPFWRA